MVDYLSEDDPELYEKVRGHEIGMGDSWGESETPLICKCGKPVTMSAYGCRGQGFCRREEFEEALIEIIAASDDLDGFKLCRDRAMKLKNPAKSVETLIAMAGVSEMLTESLEESHEELGGILEVKMHSPTCKRSCNCPNVPLEVVVKGMTEHDKDPKHKQYDAYICASRDVPKEVLRYFEGKMLGPQEPNRITKEMAESFKKDLQQAPIDHPFNPR